MRHFCILAFVAGLCLGSNIPAGGFDQFHGAQPIPKLNYDSLMMAATPLDQSADGQALLDHCIETYGGMEKLQQLKGFRLVYRMKAFLKRDSLGIVKSFQRDRQYRIDRQTSVKDEVRILNHEKAWYQSRDTVLALDGGRYNAELFSYMTLAMPLAAKTERFDDIRYGQRPDDSLAYIYMEKNDTLMIVLGIDPRDHRIKSSEGLIRQGEASFVFINRFSDFRERNGYWFAHQMTNISMGLEVARSVLTRVEINPQFKESDFQPQDVFDRRTVY